MKKTILSVFLTGFIIFSALAAEASSAYNGVVRRAISKFETKNYVGCIQDMKYVTVKDPSNSVAYYYLGSSYMKIGDAAKARVAFDKVISINSSPALVSYSIQAKYCMDGGSCAYKKLTVAQINEMKRNPTEFLKALHTPKAPVAAETNQENVEINKLINGQYKNNIHPEASKVINDAKLKREMQDINSMPNRSEAPSDKEIADAVRTLAKAGYNPLQQQMNPYQANQYNNEYANLASMFGNGQNNGNNFMNMLPFLMQQQGSQGADKKVTAEMMQTMMMSQMLPDFNYSQNSNNY
ncbi:MAG: hypothetical protein PHV37_00910 [Candidatus Gastranaerophilales bacterium]|nr:hypothetical protein [Candidatus Gastranaerophilales bacterium]